MWEGEDYNIEDYDEYHYYPGERFRETFGWPEDVIFDGDSLKIEEGNLSGMTVTRAFEKLDDLLGKDSWTKEDEWLYEDLCKGLRESVVDEYTGDFVNVLEKVPSNVNNFSPQGGVSSHTDGNWVYNTSDSFNEVLEESNAYEVDQWLSAHDYKLNPTELEKYYEKFPYKVNLDPPATLPPETIPPVAPKRSSSGFDYSNYDYDKVENYYGEIYDDGETIEFENFPGVKFVDTFEWPKGRMFNGKTRLVSDGFIEGVMTVEDAFRELDSLLSREYWSYSDHMRFNHIINGLSNSYVEEGATEKILTREQADNIINNYLPRGGADTYDRMSNMGSCPWDTLISNYSSGVVDEWINYRRSSNPDFQLTEEQQAEYYAKFPYKKTGETENQKLDIWGMYRRNKNAFKLTKFGDKFSQDGRVIVPIDDEFKRNVIIDKGDNRLGEQDTRIEQESGDFHVNIKELTDSASIAINLESFSLSAYEIYESMENIDESLDLFNGYGSLAQNINTSIRNTRSNLDSLFETAKELSDRTANYINCVRILSAEADEMLTEFFMQYGLNQVYAILDENTSGFHVYSFGALEKRYLEWNIENFLGDGVERSTIEDIRKVVTACAEWEYEHMTEEEKREHEKKTYVLSVLNGIEQDIEAVGDGFANVFATIDYYATQAFGSEEDKERSKEHLQYVREQTAFSQADENYWTYLRGSNVNVKIGYGEYHEMGLQSGHDLFNLAVKATGSDALQIVVTMAKNVGSDAQKLAKDESISDEAYAGGVGASVALNVCSTAVNKATGKISVTDDKGVFDFGAAERKLSYTVLGNVIGNVRKDLPSIVSAIDDGTFNLNEFVTEKSEEYANSALSSVVTSAISMNNDKYNNFNKRMKKGTKIYGYVCQDSRFFGGIDLNNIIGSAITGDDVVKGINVDTILMDVLIPGAN